jgi:hypothetical protein
MVKRDKCTVEERSLITIEQSSLIQLTIKLNNSRMVKRDKSTIEHRSLIRAENSNLITVEQSNLIQKSNQA